MKEAILTDINGKYIEPTLVADSVTGVFERREPVQKDVPVHLSSVGDEPSEPETVMVGYTVAIRPPDGLYQPTFDVVGYREAQEKYETAYAQYEAKLAKRNSEGESDADKKPIPELPQQVDGTSFWHNGLTDEEIAALHAQSQPEPSQIDMLGQQLTQARLDNINHKLMLDKLGAELASTKLQLMNVRGEASR